MHQIRIPSLVALQIAYGSGSRVPRPPLIGFNLGRGVVESRLRTPVEVRGMCIYTKSKKGKTPVVPTFYSVCVTACQPRLQSRPVVQDAGWRRSTVLCDITTHRDI